MIVKGQLTVVAPERSYTGGGGLFTEHKFATLARVPTARKHKAQSVLVSCSSLRQQGTSRPSQQPAHARATTLKLRARVSLSLGTAVVLVGDS